MFGAASAYQFEKGSIQITHPWTRATPGGTTVDAGYLAITNNGQEADRLGVERSMALFIAGGIVVAVVSLNEYLKSIHR